MRNRIAAGFAVLTRVMTMDDDTRALRREIDRRRLRAVLAKAQPARHPPGTLRHVWRTGLSRLSRLRREEPPVPISPLG